MSLPKREKVPVPAKGDARFLPRLTESPTNKKFFDAHHNIGLVDDYALTRLPESQNHTRTIIQCPYQPVHRFAVRKDRHPEQCRRHLKAQEVVKCQFNKFHWFFEGEEEEHYRMCSTLLMLRKRYQYKMPSFGDYLMGETPLKEEVVQKLMAEKDSMKRYKWLDSPNHPWAVRPVVSAAGWREFVISGKLESDIAEIVLDAAQAVDLDEERSRGLPDFYRRRPPRLVVPPGAERPKRKVEKTQRGEENEEEVQQRWATGFPDDMIEQMSVLDFLEDSEEEETLYESQHLGELVDTVKGGLPTEWNIEEAGGAVPEWAVGSEELRATDGAHAPVTMAEVDGLADCKTAAQELEIPDVASNATTEEQCKGSNRTNPSNGSSSSSRPRSVPIIYDPEMFRCNRALNRKLHEQQVSLDVSSWGSMIHQRQEIWGKVYEVLLNDNSSHATLQLAMSIMDRFLSKFVKLHREDVTALPMDRVAEAAIIMADLILNDEPDTKSYTSIFYKGLSSKAAYDRSEEVQAAVKLMLNITGGDVIDWTPASFIPHYLEQAQLRDAANPLFLVQVEAMSTLFMMDPEIASCVPPSGLAILAVVFQSHIALENYRSQRPESQDICDPTYFLARVTELLIPLGNMTDKYFHELTEFVLVKILGMDSNNGVDLECVRSFTLHWRWALKAPLSELEQFLAYPVNIPLELEAIPMDEFM